MIIIIIAEFIRMMKKWTSRTIKAFPMIALYLEFYCYSNVVLYVRSISKSIRGIFHFFFTKKKTIAVELNELETLFFVICVICK